MVEVIGTDEFTEWFCGIDDATARAVAHDIDVLELVGVALGYPHSSALEGSRFAVRELRTNTGGHAVRTLCIFDPRRNAVLLIGGDKTGDSRFYETIIPRAERI